MDSESGTILLVIGEAPKVSRLLPDRHPIRVSRPLLWSPSAGLGYMSCS